jgi:hypothetical protein
LLPGFYGGQPFNLDGAFMAEPIIATAFDGSSVAMHDGYLVALWWDSAKIPAVPYKTPIPPIQIEAPLAIATASDGSFVLSSDGAHALALA